MLRKLRRLLDDTEGAVFAEAVIMLPVLILMWAIIIYLHSAFRAGMHNASVVRDHAWTHAFSSCEWEPPAPTSVSPAGSAEGETYTGPISFLLSSGIIPGFSIDEVRTEREGSLDRPRHLGGGEKRYDWFLVMLCNEPSRDPGDAPFWEAWLDWGL